ncbi:hypothetical protein KUTeg_008980 [Tegillarca granosa]|uniref:Uncharacterized protein n=1 Tax=Tegillarca granosa TaxID=220873 RepID=A0ABQ9F807_TEGGR|nr:hypothetical protein KUTeg_008980 [Tegillarca granosa]
MSVATTTTPSKLDTITASKTPEHLLSKTVISKSSAKPDRKVNPIDNKLENRLTIKDLNKLQRAFMVSHDDDDDDDALISVFIFHIP